MVALPRVSLGTDPSAKTAAGTWWKRTAVSLIFLLLISELAYGPLVHEAAASKQKPAGPQ